MERRPIEGSSLSGAEERPKVGSPTPTPELETWRSLKHREGLPESLAYLRSTYPRSSWPKHRNFGELSSFWLQTHQALRFEGAQLGDAVAEFRSGARNAAGLQPRLAPQISQFLQQLHAHHEIEDFAYFPKFRALDERMVAGFDLLERDHEIIHKAILDSARSAQGFLAVVGHGKNASLKAVESYSADADRLLALLLRHLSDEEDLIIPAMLHYGERSIR